MPRLWKQKARIDKERKEEHTEMKAVKYIKILQV